MAINRTSRIQHDTPKKNRFIGLVQGGKSVRQAGAITGIPSSTASNLWKKWAATGTTQNLARSGRPSKVTDWMKRTLIRKAENN